MLQLKRKCRVLKKCKGLNKVNWKMEIFIPILLWLGDWIHYNWGRIKLFFVDNLWIHALISSAQREMGRRENDLIVTRLWVVHVSGSWCLFWGTMKYRWIGWLGLVKATFFTWTGLHSQLWNFLPCQISSAFWASTDIGGFSWLKHVYSWARIHFVDDIYSKKFEALGLLYLSTIDTDWVMKSHLLPEINDVPVLLTLRGRSVSWHHVTKLPLPFCIMIKKIYIATSTNVLRSREKYIIIKK